jgi:hypothetical protein
MTDSLLQSLSLGFLLRSIFAGVFFVASFYTATDYPSQFAKMKELGATDMLGIALFSGVIIYCIHRAVVYPLIEWALDSALAQSLRAKVPLISTLSVTALVRRWDRNSSDADGPNPERAKNISTWGDYTHLLYVSALCILMGAVSARVSSKATLEMNCPLTILCVFLGCAALISDWRLRRVDETAPPAPDLKKSDPVISPQLT